MRESRLEFLTTKFENLRMSDEETISDLNGRLCDIRNELFALGEKIFEERLVTPQNLRVPLIHHQSSKILP